MKFNVTGEGLVQEIDALCSTTITDYPLADKTRRINTALETVISKIIKTDGTWQFDDENFTTSPTGTQDLVNGQQAYSFTDKILQIENVKIMDKNNVYQLVNPLDQRDTNGMSLESLYTVNGFPEFYDKRSNTVKFYPTPSSSLVTLTNGLKIEFKRTGSLFTVADTTKEPGFASSYHIILAWMSALPYCKAYKPDRVPQLERDIFTMMKEIEGFYSKREKDHIDIITTEIVNPY